VTRIPDICHLKRKMTAIRRIKWRLLAGEARRAGPEQPEKAMSDGANAPRLDKLGGLLRRLRAMDGLVKREAFIGNGVGAIQSA
jgi:hypothetical protein